uniref:Kelch-like protein 5 n=1 Tax=Nicotiana tabacum TaxID=4097 RepID=A0A1S3XFH2_TOBAC
LIITLFLFHFVTLYSIIRILKSLTGLPIEHFSYVKNVHPGLPLFLFNYNDRKIHGIFEAVSSGQMHINPYSWTSDGYEKTRYPAQVQIRVRLQCQPLPENQFKPIILDNYYSQNHFWFELDHVQSNKLISKLASLAIAPSKTLYNSANWGNIIQDLPENVMIADNGSFEPQVLENKSSSSVDVNRKFGAGDISPCSKGSVLQLESPLDFHAALDEKDFIYKKLRELVLERECSGAPTNGHAEERTNEVLGNPVNDVSIGKAAFRKARLPGEEKNEESSCDSAVYPSFVVQLLQGMEELIAFNEEQHKKMGGLEQKLADIQEEIKLLKNKCLMLESSNPLRTHAGENVVDSDDVAHLNDESIILAGGYDGVSWLSAFDSYSPLNDVFKSLKPMNSVRSFFALANLSREIYVFGGRCGSLWSNGVESYNPADNKWTVHPCLNEKKGSLSGAALKDKIFAVGGGNGIESFSQVEMYDPQVGRWISTRSMWQKRFALAAAELNGALYAVGGFDGNNYLATAERFDPREHSWTKIESMSTKRGSHALVALRGKLYALGGHDGYQMVPSIEIYDPRRGTWMIGEPMNCSRGYSAAAVLKESIYVIGGVKSDNEIIDTIECYKEDQGWQTTTSRAVGKRCFSSAVVSEEC